MRIRLLLQVGAYHKEKENPDADFLKLYESPETIMRWAMEEIDHNFRVKQEHKMADGTPFLIEFESVSDVPLKAITPTEVSNES